jgi:hypothetical protein
MFAVGDQRRHRGRPPCTPGKATSLERARALTMDHDCALPLPMVLDGLRIACDDIRINCGRPIIPLKCPPDAQQVMQHQLHCLVARRSPRVALVFECPLNL